MIRDLDWKNILIRVCWHLITFLIGLYVATFAFKYELQRYETENLRLTRDLSIAVVLGLESEINYQMCISEKVEKEKRDATQR